MANLTVDEFEAIRLADHLGLYQADVAAHMGVSRQTVGRILQLARGKVAEALVEGKGITIEGGIYETVDVRTFMCKECEGSWEEPFGTGRPESCPHCGGQSIHRTDGHGRHGGGRGCGGHGHGRGKKE